MYFEVGETLKGDACVFPGFSWDMFDPHPSEGPAHSTSGSNSQTCGPGTSELPPTSCTESSAGLKNTKLSVQNMTADILLQDMRAIETTGGFPQGVRMNEAMAVVSQGLRVGVTTSVLPHGMKTIEKDQTQSRVLLCEFCDASFTSTGGLSLHKNSVHFKRKFACTICEKRFTRKENLTHHMNVHNRNGVECPYCHVRFVSKDFTDHIKMCKEHRE